MQERVMPVEPADELPELLGGACHDAGGGWCCGHRLLRVGNHCRDSPFLSNHWYDAGLRDAVARDSFSVMPGISRAVPRLDRIGKSPSLNE
jgi:hypothetical protein